YQLQAAISALHSTAKTSAETDWDQIVALYGKLLELNPSPIIALNQAVAVAMNVGFEEGLKRIDALGGSGELENYYLFHAARADLLRRLQRPAQAADSYRRALELVTNEIERTFLRDRLKDMESSISPRSQGESS